MYLEEHCAVFKNSSGLKMKFPNASASKVLSAAAHFQPVVFHAFCRIG
jgi:hypothetical protein